MPSDTKRSAQGLTFALVCVFAAIYAVVFSWLGIARFQSTFSQDWRDEGVNNQMMFNTAGGEPLLTTIKGTLRHHRHFRPIFLPASLAYLVFRDVRAWYILVAVMMAAGAFAARRIGLRLFNDHWAGFLAACIWLCWPALHEITLGNLDPETFVAVFWLFAVAAFLENRYRSFMVFSVLALICKETQAPVFAAFGLLAALDKRSLRWTVLPILIGAVWFLLAVNTVIPTYHPTYDTVFNRFIGVERTEFPIGFLKALFTEPAKTLSQMFSRAHLTLVFNILRSLGFTAFLSPLPILGVGSIVLQILLLKDSLPVRQAHMVSAILPFAYWASISGMQKASDWLGKWRKLQPGGRKGLLHRTLLALVILLCLFNMNKPGLFGLYQSYGLDPLEGLQASNVLDPAFRSPTAAEQRVWREMRNVAPDDVVMSNARLLLALSSRRTLWEFGTQKDASEFESTQLIFLWLLKTECHTCTFNDLTPENLTLAASLVSSGKFGVAAFDPAYAVLASKSFPPKNFQGRPELEEGFFRRIDELKERLLRDEGLPPDEARN